MPLLAETSLKPEDLSIEVIESIPFGENTYVAHRRDSNECIAFDPGLQPELILEYLQTANLQLAAILITHGHCDHIAGTPALKQAWPNVPVVIGRGDAPMLTDAELNLSAKFGLPYTCDAADVLLDEGEVYAAAGLEFETRTIPGHSPGHVVFVVREMTPPVVFGGERSLKMANGLEKSISSCFALP